MRLSATETKTIREEIRRLDSSAEIRLFGSRTDDQAQGGDIDLLVISDRLTFRDLLHLRTAILDKIGWQQLDLLIRRRDEAREPFVALALETGIPL